MASETQGTREKLEAAVKSAAAEIDRLREAHAGIAEVERYNSTVDGRAEMTRLQGLINDARGRHEKAEAALRVFDKTGEEHALVAEEDRVVGSIAVRVAPGVSHEERGKIIDDALTDKLDAAAAELGVVLSAAPSRYTRERPGRDEEGRTVLDVAGRVEGDLLVPAVNRTSRNLRR